ncbi:MAG: hypothetical protein ACFFBD_01275 [Candidatus Hodarchaeota archaeon]
MSITLGKDNFPLVDVNKLSSTLLSESALKEAAEVPTQDPLAPSGQNSFLEQLFQDANDLFAWLEKYYASGQDDEY